MNKFFKRVCGLLFLILCVTSLTSCSLLLDMIETALNGTTSTSSSEGSETTYQNYTLVSTPTNCYLSSDTREDKEKAGHLITLDQVKSQEDYVIFPSTGEQKVLVIPVYFPDFPLSTCFKVTEEEAINNIYNVYFGQSEDTGWESVSSFYEKSSYGNLKISGKVTSFCELDRKLLDIASLTSYNDPSIYILRYAVNWFKKNYPDEVSSFDVNKDGYIDNVQLVYANPYYSSKYTSFYDRYYGGSRQLSKLEDLLWAYTYWDYDQKSSTSSPVANVYTWLSYYFMWDGGYSKTTGSLFNQTTINLVDGHTFIHEFGHTLGLDDYYSYDSNDISPIGTLDMMDYNIGDHNSFSKYMLNWIEPQYGEYVSSDGCPYTYTLESFATTGDCLLVPFSNNFSYSPFDEYLLIELYTPENLFEQDALKSYSTNTSYPQFFTKVGIRVYHVDSRLVVVDSVTKAYYYTYVNNNLKNSISKYQMIGHSNTPSYSINSSYRLISMLSRKGGYVYNANRDSTATNDDLYVKGDVINYTTHGQNDYLYQINIADIYLENGAYKATIEISR